MTFLMIVIVLVGLDHREEIPGASYPTYAECMANAPLGEAVAKAVEQADGYPAYAIHAEAECRQVIEQGTQP